MKVEGLSIPRSCVELPSPPFFLNSWCIFLLFSLFYLHFVVVNKVLKIVGAVFGEDQMTLCLCPRNSTAHSH